MLSSSVASPTGVPVAWHSTSPMLAGSSPACFHASEHGALLALDRRRQEASTTPVVAQAHPPNHGVDLVPVALRILEPLQGQETGALGGYQAIRLGVEGAASAGL